MPSECAGVARDASNVEEGVRFLYWVLSSIAALGSAGGVARREALPTGMVADLLAEPGAKRKIPSSECAGSARNPAKVEDQVQFLARALVSFSIS